MEILKELALAQVGKPYLWGKQNPLLGFDCSGLIVFILRTVGLINTKADYTAQGLHEMLIGEGARRSREYGAIAFYGTNDRAIKHCAFCIDDTWCVEANGDSSCKTISDAINWRDGASVRLSLIENRRDLYICLRPIYRTLGEKQ